METCKLMAYLKVSFSLTSMSTGQFVAPAFCEFRYATFSAKVLHKKTAGYMGVSRQETIAMKPRMSMITLGVDDLNRAIEFYKVGLEFPHHGEGDDVAFFDLNGTWLGLYGREALAEDAQVNAEGVGFNSFTISHCNPPNKPKAEKVEYSRNRYA